jgi:hypothetical protein
MAGAYQRHDISDAVWALLEPRLLERKSVWGSITHAARVKIVVGFRQPTVEYRCPPNASL